jgi:hypothetical protein
VKEGFCNVEVELFMSPKLHSHVSAPVDASVNMIVGDNIVVGCGLATNDAVGELYTFI